MRKMRWVFWGLTILGLGLSFSVNNLSSAKPSILSKQVRYDIVKRSHHTIHTVTIPQNSNYILTLQVSNKLKSLPEFVEQESTKQNKVIAAINGGYFDPINYKTTSFITQNSQTVADPRLNERLVDNPDLKLYLEKIFNRAEFRRYSCGTKTRKKTQKITRYDIQLHSAPIPQNCTLKESLGAGPGLLPKDSSTLEAFTTYQNGARIRDVIGRDSLNARSAIGITKNGGVILAMVEQQQDQPMNSGISLPELTNFLSSLGAVKAMNLDGGSSASLYYDDHIIYGKVDKTGNKIQRPIKSVLLVTQKQ